MKPPTYNAGYLLDSVLASLRLRSDSALARLLETTPLIIAKIRKHDHPVGASLLIRMHEVTGMSVRELRDLMGDRRTKYRLGGGSWTDTERAAYKSEEAQP